MRSDPSAASLGSVLPMTLSLNWCHLSVVGDNDVDSDRGVGVGSKGTFNGNDDEGGVGFDKDVCREGGCDVLLVFVFHCTT